MSQTDCGTVRGLIPDFAGNRLSDDEARTVEVHLTQCGGCRAELELVQLLYASRAQGPEGLAERVVEAVRADRRPGQRPWWGISAAAVAALALGIGIMSEPSAPAFVDLTEFASEFEEEDVWMSDDGLLAGAPSVDGLSDEALLELLDELAGNGGAA